MARPRKPTKVLELSGAFIKDPQRRKGREGEPEVSEPLGPPPAYLDENEKTRWTELAGMAYWLTKADRLAVEIAARMWAKLMRREATPPEIKCLQTEEQKLGLNPVDRTRVKAPNAKQTSKLDKYA